MNEFEQGACRFSPLCHQASTSMRGPLPAILSWLSFWDASLGTISTRKAMKIPLVNTTHALPTHICRCVVYRLPHKLAEQSSSGTDTACDHKHSTLEAILSWSPKPGLLRSTERWSQKKVPGSICFLAQSPVQSLPGPSAPSNLREVHLLLPDPITGKTSLNNTAHRVHGFHESR